MNPTTTFWFWSHIFSYELGWYGTGNGWFSGNNVNPTNDRNYQYDKRKSVCFTLKMTHYEKSIYLFIVIVCDMLCRL